MKSIFNDPDKLGSQDNSSHWSNESNVFDVGTRTENFNAVNWSISLWVSFTVHKFREWTVMYLIPIKAAYHIQICGVGDSTVDDEHTIVDDSAEGQPAIYALD